MILIFSPQHFLSSLWFLFLPATWQCKSAVDHDTLYISNISIMITWPLLLSVMDHFLLETHFWHRVMQLEQTPLYVCPCMDVHWGHVVGSHTGNTLISQHTDYSKQQSDPLSLKTRPAHVSSSFFLACESERKKCSHTGSTDRSGSYRFCLQSLLLFEISDPYISPADFYDRPLECIPACIRGNAQEPPQ